MKIGIVTPDINEDRLSAELFEAVSQRASAYLINPEDIKIDIGKVSEIWLGENRVGIFDALIIRQLSSFGNLDFQFQILQQCEKDGLLIINSMKSLETAESKFSTSLLLNQYGLPVPETLVCQTCDTLEKFIRKHRDIIVKPLYGQLGQDIYRIKDRRNFGKIKHLLKEQGAIIAQQYIKGKGKDYRVFVVGDFVIGAIERRAVKGWITNIFAGGKATKISVNDELRNLCVKAAQIAGLDYCGVDVIKQGNKNYILELNGSPSWEGLAKATGRNVPADIVSHVLRKIYARKQMPYLAS